MLSEMAPLSNAPLIFNRSLLRLRRQRALQRFHAYDFLHQESAEQLRLRLQDVKDGRFESVLDLSPHTILQQKLLIDSPGIKIFHQPNDEEALPFPPNCYDLVISNLGLHWVNDLPGLLSQSRQTLKTKGLFLGSMLGGATLAELRQCLAEAEIKLFGGMSPRFSPLADLRDMAALMQRAGFYLPVCDSDKIEVTYRDAFALMHDLRGMGETNAIIAQRKTCSARRLFFETAEIYQRRWSDSEGQIKATFEIYYLHGWNG